MWILGEWVSGFEGFFLDVRGRRNYLTDGHVELSLVIWFIIIICELIHPIFKRPLL